MRRRYMVCYDVSDPGRLRQTYKKMLGFGEHVQYSVFMCDLSEKEKALLEDALQDLLDLRQDRVLIVDVGSSEERRTSRIVVMGSPVNLPSRDPGIE